MRYFGGKTRICKDISSIINKNVNGMVFLSPFVGGGWVEHLVRAKRVCCDKHPYLIAMYNAIQDGWEPPKHLTKEEYNYIKKNPDENPALTGFVGFGCSFAGKWFGGYAKQTGDRNFCLNAYNSLMKKMKCFNNTVFKCVDYKDIIPIDNVIYCDPPYRGTTQYAKKILGGFDHDEFWDIMRDWSKNNVVIVSEHNAPEDFKCIWSKKSKLDIRDKNNQKKKVEEKLFSLNNIIV